MAVTSDNLRSNFPEFASKATYPDAEVAFWLGLGLLMLNADRWGDVIDYGLQLFVAHNLSLQFNATKAAATGQNPGEVKGPVTSGSVDKVSYSRDTAAVMDPKNGHWNLSIYGIRYIRLVGMVGAGPVHVGAPPAGGLDNSAWPGPWQSIVPNPSN